MNGSVRDDIHPGPGDDVYSGPTGIGKELPGVEPLGRAVDVAATEIEDVPRDGGVDPALGDHLAESVVRLCVH